ncbi:hypothetical protein JW992_12325 [candidate division KSB1 bacterium]|nr:hypothetical protein [candidate division KSB1 bacterium]
MTGKQRVLMTMRGEEPDRVPIGEFAIDFDTVEKIIGHETYVRAKAKSQIAFWEGRHDEVAESYLNDQLELYRKIDIDIITFPMATWEIPPETDDPPPKRIDDTTWEDRWGRIYKYSDLTADITCIVDPVAESRVYTRKEFEADPVIPQPDARSWKILDTLIRTFKDEKFICGPSGGEIGILFLGGIERGCMELLTNPDVVRQATDFYLKQQNAADSFFIHPDSDSVLWGADFGFKTAPLISPAMFDDFFLQANRLRVERIHNLFDKKVMKHCCGNIQALLNSFLEIGYDAYQSIQASADMDICRLKSSIGDRITLWGGVSLENLVSGSPDDVRADVRRAMTCAKKGGRFILGASHSIAVGTNYENYMAMLDEYHNLCTY